MSALPPKADIDPHGLECLLCAISRPAQRYNARSCQLRINWLQQTIGNPLKYVTEVSFCQVLFLDTGEQSLLR